jgi:hypothetical protein
LVQFQAYAEPGDHEALNNLVVSHQIAMGWDQAADPANTAYREKAADQIGVLITIARGRLVAVLEQIPQPASAPVPEQQSTWSDIQLG